MRLTILHSLLLSPLLALVVGCGGGDDSSDDSAAVTDTTSGGGASTAAPTGGGGTDVTPWAGRTYLLTIPYDNWIDPQGIGPEIGPHVPSFMMTVNSGTANSMNVTVTSANSAGVQEMCTPTTTVEMTSGGPYPAAQIGPFDFPVHLKTADGTVQVNTTIHDMQMVNVLPGQEAAEDGEVIATLDMREIYPMFTILMAQDADQVCNALQDFEAPCQPCPDSAPYCLTITAILVGAEEVTTPVTPVAPGTQPATCAGALDG